jgi:hypothetical protein
MITTEGEVGHQLTTNLIPSCLLIKYLGLLGWTAHFIASTFGGVKL